MAESVDKPPEATERDAPETPTGVPQNPLGDLESDLAALDGDIQATHTAMTAAETEAKKAADAVDAAKAQKKDLDARKLALLNLVGEIKNKQKEVGAQRQAADREAADARTFLVSVTDGLAAKLTAEQRTALDGALGAAGDEIGGLRAKVDELGARVAEAQAANEEARALPARKEAALRAAQERLRQLPTEIQAARSAVAKQRTALQDAYDKGKPSQAYLLSKDFEAALGILGNLTGARHEADLVLGIQDAWKALSQAQDESTATAATLKGVEAELAKAQAALQEAEKKRSSKVGLLG
jgi:chromosome segregation ATPase